MRGWDMTRCTLSEAQSALVPKSTYIPWMALTATASRKVREDVCFNLQLVLPYTVVTSFDRPNLKYYVLPRSGTSHVDIIRLLLKKNEEHIRNCSKAYTHGANALSSVPFPPTLIYVKSRRDCEEISDAIQKYGGTAFDSIGMCNILFSSMIHVYGCMSDYRCGLLTCGYERCRSRINS